MNEPKNGRDPIDVHVGKRVREAREAKGISQTALGVLIGPVAFQQVQKYETGGNRISASRLYKIAVALDRPVAWFFEGLRETAATSRDIEHASKVSFRESPDGKEYAVCLVDRNGEMFATAVVSLDEALVFAAALAKADMARNPELYQGRQ